MNMVFEMSREPGNAHQGLFMENGSGGFMSDLVFRGGNRAMFVGNQQWVGLLCLICSDSDCYSRFTVRNISISDADTAIFAIWNWGMNLRSIVNPEVFII